MSPDDVASAVELLDRRRQVLGHLGRGGHHVRDLCDELDVSRSTVNRALRELEDAGWVERADDGYVRTTTGSLALQEYRDQVTALDAVQRHADALAPLPGDTPLEPAVLADATVETVAEADPFELVGRLRSALEDATAVRGVWPSVTDDRTVSTLRSLVDDGAAVALAVDEGVHETMRSVAPTTFGPDDTAEVRVETSDDVPTRLGVFLVEAPDASRVFVTIYEEGGSIHAVADVAATEAATSWATTVFDAAETPSVDRKTGVSSLVGAAADVPRWDEASKAVLRSQGFVPVDERTLAHDDDRSPGAMLRTTPTLGAVAAGRTLDREHVVDGQRREFAVDLVDALATGGNLAVVGPPGAGKSTVCKAAACRWRERGNGPVCYRESDSAAVLDDPLRLAASLDEAPGTPLVVVEDAVRPAANAVFEALEQADDDIAFLFDARQSEWSSPPEPLDPRRESLRQGGVETVQVPDLDDQERVRLHDHVASIVDGPIPPLEEFVDDEDLAGDSARPPQATGSDGAGELLTLAHRYGNAADIAVEGDRRTASPLSRNVRDVYDDVADDPAVLVVATLVNVLNAGGLPVERDLLDALALDDDGPEPRAVERAVTALQGKVLFPHEDGVAAVHDAWSHSFLTYLVDEREDASAHRIFAAAVNPLFRLVTEPSLRSEVVRYRQGDAPTVDAFDDSPDHWRDVVVDRVFELGRDSPNLAPLYGHPKYTELGLPESCSTWCRRHALVGRAQMYVDAGDFDAARQECERIETVAETTASTRQQAVLRARSLEVQSIIAESKGEFDRSRELAEESLELVREVDDRKGEASVLNGLGLLAWYQGDIDEAERRLRDALSIFDEVESKRTESEVLNHLGIVQWERGDLANAVEFFEASYRQYREIGARGKAVSTSINLGIAARDRGSLDEAVGRLRGAVEEAQRLGVAKHESNANRALGNALRWRGALDESATHLAEALDIARKEELRYHECRALRGLAATHRERGAFEKSARLLETCDELVAEVGDERDRALARAHRGLLVLAGGDAVEATEILGDAVETLESLDRSPGLARARRWHARALEAAGEYEQARDAYEAAVDQYEAIGASAYLRETLDELSEVCERTGADETAATYRDRRDALEANN
ncbi:tetratricopeptide repeat protein [Haloarchaeobius iranensis]|uniref:Tetratricopeptide repeat-containing protein n=1 Tax=Haloarchaeobius iranensis TaxID=996166 RepID=A0A1G9UG75_9EURY|nr:tetratricopeptide repeat protein [Haloarchaeobius iranensis]SDM58960.1 Tetratricopeptide repeat-containing protein [Haloarchaeobius iranensis]